MDKQKCQAKIYFWSLLFGALHRQVGWISFQVGRTSISGTEAHCRCPFSQGQNSHPLLGTWLCLSTTEGLFLGDGPGLALLLSPFFNIFCNPLQYSCLENPGDAGACWAAVYAVAQSRTRLKQRSSSSSRLGQMKKDFPGDPVVRLWVPSAGALGSIPGQGSRSHVPQSGVHVPRRKSEDPTCCNWAK